MPPYSFLLISLLKSCQGCTPPYISRHLNTTPEASELFEGRPVFKSPRNLSETPATDGVLAGRTSLWNDAASYL